MKVNARFRIWWPRVPDVLCQVSFVLIGIENGFGLETASSTGAADEVDDSFKVEQ